METVYDWYKIFNLDEFEALELGSKNYVIDFEDKGVKEILVCSSNTVSLTYEGVMLSINLNDKNPFEMSGFAVYLKENNDVYLGLPIET